MPRISVRGGEVGAFGDIKMGIFDKLFGRKREEGETSARSCESCGKPLFGETAKLVSQSGPNQVLVRAYCSLECADPLVKSFLDRKVCIWCGKKADPQSWKLGGLGEPYCSEECYSAAGRAMFTFEFRQGNI